MGIFESFTVLFAPDDCLACGYEGSLLCEACFSKMPPLPSHCFNCRSATVDVAACAICMSDQPYSSLTVVAHYTGLAKLLVASLKFRGNRSAAHIMARLILQRAQRIPTSAVITHMPATTAHVRQRGFDQAAIIAKCTAKVDGVSFCSLLQRSGSSHQLGADRQTRLIQLGQALRVTRDVRDKHVVLVDDVLTTGASLRIASELLLRAGAKRVDCLVFAQAFTKEVMDNK